MQRARPPCHCPLVCAVNGLNGNPMCVRKQGSYVMDRNRTTELRTWVAERAQRCRGSWGSGCIVCTLAVHQLEGVLGLGARITYCRLESKWAQSEVRAQSLPVQAIAQHGCVAGHKMAKATEVCHGTPVQESFIHILSMEDGAFSQIYVSPACRLDASR